MNYDTETHYDKEVNFIYEGLDYVWHGDYLVTYCGEDASEYAPGYGETEVQILHTNSLSYYDAEKEEVIEVIPTSSIICELETEIERYL